MSLNNLILTPLLALAIALTLGACDKDDHADDSGHDHSSHGDSSATAAAAADDGYPLKTCVVSGEELGGSMGAPFVINHNGTTVKFCCDSCVDDFNKEPEKYLAKLTAKP